MRDPGAIRRVRFPKFPGATPRDFSYVMKWLMFQGRFSRKPSLRSKIKKGNGYQNLQTKSPIKWRKDDDDGGEETDFDIGSRDHVTEVTEVCCETLERNADN